MTGVIVPPIAAIATTQPPIADWVQPVRSLPLKIETRPGSLYGEAPVPPLGGPLDDPPLDEPLEDPPASSVPASSAPPLELLLELLLLELLLLELPPLDPPMSPPLLELLLELLAPPPLAPVGAGGGSPAEQATPAIPAAITESAANRIAFIGGDSLRAT